MKKKIVFKVQNVLPPLTHKSQLIFFKDTHQHAIKNRINKNISIVTHFASIKILLRSVVACDV